jgi:hypothetical protein
MHVHSASAKGARGIVMQKTCHELQNGQGLYDYEIIGISWDINSEMVKKQG